MLLTNVYLSYTILNHWTVTQITSDKGMNFVYRYLTFWIMVKLLIDFDQLQATHKKAIQTRTIE